MAELVGGALLSAFLQVAFDRLASPEILDYFRGRRLDETLLRKLKNMLSSINVVIDDAEQKQFNNPYVKAWLDDVKDAVYDAEDVLDEIDYEASKRKLEADEFQTATTSKVWSFFSASFSSFDKEIESRVKQVLDNLEYLASRKDILQLKEGCGVGVGSVRKLPTTSLVDEAGIYGRDDEKEMIIEWLLSHNDDGNPVSILSIVGMGGLGKSTLAQLVYNDKRITDEFDLRAWICVSEDFDVLRITRTIIEAITMSNGKTKDINMLQTKLKEMLTGKRFFLVLDDVWNENYILWEALQAPFIHGASGSKILITTRSDIVASTVRSTTRHPLELLTESDSWSLFKSYAFCDGDIPDFEEIGRKITKMCKGLPLALKTIGSLLYTKLSLEEWNGILKSEIWVEEGKGNILPALRLSYHYLPSLLKRCFAYCSLFPKDYEFHKEHLIQLWIDENFLECNDQSKDIKEVGEKIFYDLLLRSFFQPSSDNEMYFIMHDLINDLAKSVHENFCFRLEVDKTQNLSKMTRHLSFFGHGKEDSKRFEGIYKANKLRTFLPMHHGGSISFMPDKMIDDLLSTFRCLRILSLSSYFNIIDLPKSIGNLKHLRYLNLSHTRVRRLPDSICLLYNLRTLNLRDCRSLKMLPSDLHKLINLRHLDFRETRVIEMPKHLGKLKNLQLLSSFYVGKCRETSITQLEKLKLQGSLSILELQNVLDPIDSSAANLKNKLSLEVLMLGWSNKSNESQNERDVLEKLQPHQNLKKLSISNYGGTRFPDWFSDNTLSNVVALELSNCKYCFFLPALGLLPSLKSLSIVGFDSIEVIGPEFYGNTFSTTPFASLEILEFQEMVEWKKWNCENVSGAFPCLREFYILNCPKLKEHLPAQLPSLKMLVIDKCEQLVASIPWAPSIHKLVLSNCGMLKLEYLPSTLKVLDFIGGQFTEHCLVEKIEHTIANTCLVGLEVFDCANLKFPWRHCNNLLLKLGIESSCNSLRTFPLDLFPKLQSLKLIGCSNLEKISVSKGHDHCTSLITLVIERCPQLELFPEEGLPSNLKDLSIYNCPKLIASRMEWNLHSHTSLERLTISDSDVESFPEAELLPLTLTSLFFNWCSNLKRLEYKGLCHLSTLRELRLEHCPILQCLPKEGLPNSLSILHIMDCPLLSGRCQKQEGEDWEKIAHISFIVVDGYMISYNDIIT